MGYPTCWRRKRITVEVEAKESAVVKLKIELTEVRPLEQLFLDSL